MQRLLIASGMELLHALSQLQVLLQGTRTVGQVVAANMVEEKTVVRRSPSAVNTSDGDAEFEAMEYTYDIADTDVEGAKEMSRLDISSGFLLLDGLNEPVCQGAKQQRCTGYAKTFQ